MPRRRKKLPNNVLKVKFRAAWRNHRRLTLILCLIVLLAWAIYPIKYRLEQKKRIDEYRRQIDALKKENERLNQEISRLNSDDYVEQLARKEGAFAKPGEEIFMVFGGDEATRSMNPRQEAQKPAAAKKTLWEQALNFLGL
ncbi:MAG: septum formation initiator family protein [Actinobacteria bacterium]|nr:septum formation initiator family protein [Actinomycetota bacterium]